MWLLLKTLIFIHTTYMSRHNNNITNNNMLILHPNNNDKNI